jgi:hypothetical protein
MRRIRGLRVGRYVDLFDCAGFAGFAGCAGYANFGCTPINMVHNANIRDSTTPTPAAGPLQLRPKTIYSSPI